LSGLVFSAIDFNELELGISAAILPDVIIMRPVAGSWLSATMDPVEKSSVLLTSRSCLEQSRGLTRLTGEGGNRWSDNNILVNLYHENVMQKI
jgi:hypothetical protein